MGELEAGNKAHHHYDKACDAMKNAAAATDQVYIRTCLDAAKVHLGLARLCLELRGVADTRAVRE